MRAEHEVLQHLLSEYAQNSLHVLVLHHLSDRVVALLRVAFNLRILLQVRAVLVHGFLSCPLSYILLSDTGSQQKQLGISKDNAFEGTNALDKCELEFDVDLDLLVVLFELIDQFHDVYNPGDHAEIIIPVLDQELSLVLVGVSKRQLRVRAWEAVAEERVGHLHEVTKLPLQGQNLNFEHNVIGIVDYLPQRLLVLLQNHGKVLKEHRNGPFKLLLHQLRKLVKVVIVLRPLALMEILHFLRVLIQVVIHLLLNPVDVTVKMQVLLDLRLNDIHRVLLHSLLMLQLELHRFEDKPLPHLVEVAHHKIQDLLLIGLLALQASECE